MPDTDLDTELSRLRDEMRDEMPVPGFEQVVARHKQRVIRRRMQLGAVAAVLVVSAAIPVLRAQVAPDEKPAPPGGPSYEAPEQPTGPYVSDVQFTDADHAFAIRAQCVGSPATCRETLLATDDGGEHWQKRTLPRPPSAPTWSKGNLHTLTQDELTVDWPLSAALEGSRFHRIHSTDGGRTWQTVAVPPIVTDTVPAIPEHGALVPSCARLAAGGTRCTERGFAVLQPGTGESAGLEHRPPLTAMQAGVGPTPDGRWWVVGRDPKTNRWGISISNDDGRSWTTTVLDWVEPVDTYGWSVVEQGGTLFATGVGALPDVSNGLLGIFRSTDGGRSWEQTWKPEEGKNPRRVFSDPVAASDGTLTINTPTRTYQSRDGGRTFSEAKQRYSGYAGQAEPGYIAGSVDSPENLAISEDGVHWRTIKVG